MGSLILLVLATGLAQAQKPLATPRDVVAAQAQIEALKADVATAQARLDDLKKRYSDAYPDVKTAQRELVKMQVQMSLAQLKLQLAQADTQSVPPKGDDTKIPLPDMWWKNMATVQYLGLTPGQALKMDDVVAQYRQKLAENSYELERQQKSLARMVAIAEAVNANDIAAQIDRVADARAALEKTNGHMLLGIRELLTPEQWTKLNQSFTLNLTRDPTR